MSYQRLLPSCLWLAISASCLPGCETALAPAAASKYPWPTHGNQYYNYWDAKYLGSDSASGLSYRLIDSTIFSGICQTWPNLADVNAIRSLQDSSQLITVDSSKIQDDLQWIKDSSGQSGKEYQVYLFLDRNTARISSLHGEPGTPQHSHPYIVSDRNHGVTSPIPADSPWNDARILIGQVHGHPAIPGRTILQEMSPDDTVTAICLQAPVYAIDATDAIQGTPGAIHRANPLPRQGIERQDLYIGKTWGKMGFGADSLLDIGHNALQIWGITHGPDFGRLVKIDSVLQASIPRTRHGYPATPSSLPRSL
jgi:hypothetical protein